MEAQNIQERDKKIAEQFVHMVIKKPKIWKKIIEEDRARKQRVSLSDDHIESFDPV